MGIGTEKPETSQLAMRPIDGDVAESALGELLNSAFSVPAGARYFDDFPVWVDSPKNDRIRIGIFSGDRLLSTAGARISRMKIGDRMIRMGLIGAVATHAEFRGAGLAGKVLEVALQWLGARQAAFAVLWGDPNAGLYTRLGFEPFGDQAELLLVDTVLGAPIREVREGWHPGIFDLLQRRTGGLELRPEDRAWIERHKNVRWFWTGAAGRPEAYAALGKGIDLPGFVHEWGGERAALHGLLAGLRDRHPESRILGSPKILAASGILPLPTASAPVCLAHVLNVEAVTGIEGSDFWLWGLDGA